MKFELTAVEVNCVAGGECCADGAIPGVCYPSYLIAPGATSASFGPAKNTTLAVVLFDQGTSTVTCSDGRNPYGTYKRDMTASCMPGSSMSIVCTSTNFHWCQGRIAYYS